MHRLTNLSLGRQESTSDRVLDSVGIWSQGPVCPRRSGLLEFLVAVGVDPVSGRTRQRPLHVHGSAEVAGARRPEPAFRSDFLDAGTVLGEWLIPGDLDHRRPAVPQPFPSRDWPTCVRPGALGRPDDRLRY